MVNIGVIGGGGYVGLAYAVGLADLGHKVVAVDVDATKIGMLAQGISPIFEPGLDDLLHRGLASGRLSFTTDYADAVPAADFVFICVGTPSDASGHADMRHIMAATRSVARHGQGRTVVVNKSTMPVGSVELVGDVLSEHAQPGATFVVVSNPEFLREGSAMHDVFHPSRIVLGTVDPDAAAEVAALYAPLNAPVMVTDPRSAEMIKYASNAFLATKISFINEVALICEGLGADVAAVAQGMGMDERIGSRFLQAGAGFGGSCFPKDVRALAAMAWDAGLDTNMLNAVVAINAAMRSHIVEKLIGHLGGLRQRAVAVLGLAFKPNTDDIRDAPALDVIRDLLAAGAKVRATDPAAMARVAAELPGVTLLQDPYAVATGADAVIIMTEWDDYRRLDVHRLANAMRGRVLLDARNILEPAAAAAAGLIYDGIGRSAAPPRSTAWIKQFRLRALVGE